MSFSDILICLSVGSVFYFVLDISLFYISKYILKKDLADSGYTPTWLKDQKEWNDIKKRDKK